MKVTIEYNGRSQRAEIPDHSDLAYHLQDHGPVPAVVKERVYRAIYVWIPDKEQWKQQSVTTDKEEAEDKKDRLEEGGKKVRIIETTDPTQAPERVEGTQEDKQRNAHIREWKQYKGMGDKAAQHAYEELGPIDQADLSNLEDVKHVGDATAQNVRIARGVE